MFAGHFGVAAIVKAKAPEVPLWSLIVSSQLMDLVFLPLSLAGVEMIELIGDGGYGETIIHADYTHSLIGALLISLIAGLLAGLFWNRKSGIIIGSVAFSHWLLDLIVHRSDMPILPGNLGGFPLLGLGLWAVPTVSMAFEGLLIIAGSLLYFRYAINSAGSQRRGIGALMGSTMMLFLVFSLLSSMFS
ncbi:permease [Metabacillus sediminilitoris]|uniref:Permease n=1 Tax=Metabacillus sediminilitoris TaxID=2567941 RepID=A0A4S4BU43_9BACI|nr:permease [Metabacillus sediminilitoris]QGQ44999.1 permease [Metabacillus sediminilitoris]THF78632.1 permease [Metabacillus sediminilitoris]